MDQDFLDIQYNRLICGKKSDLISCTGYLETNIRPEIFNSPDIRPDTEFDMRSVKKSPDIRFSPFWLKNDVRQDVLFWCGRLHFYRMDNWLK